MKRKMLISIALVVIMLLNCMMPLFVVTAAEGEGIQLNSKLYSAVKASLIDQKIPFTCDDITHTLTLSEENKSKVTEMCLNENAISDLTGLDYFSSLTKVELSGNNITKDSNLEVLNSLPLTYLDLSTNQLEDVSAIDALIDSIESKKGTVLLSGQTVTIVYEAIVDESEDSSQAIFGSYELPLILEKAGFVKSAWMKQSGIPEDESVNSARPTLYSIQNPVMEGHNEIKVRIADDFGNPYKGLYKLEIYIYDDPTEAASAANLNPAATNILNGSRFYIYVVVHGNEDTAVFTPDSNLYRAVKTQLTAGQTENKNLDSFGYAVDVNGEMLFTTCYMVRLNDFMYELYVYDQSARGKSTIAPDFILLSMDNGKTGMIFEYDVFAGANPNETCAQLMDQFKQYAYATEYELVDIRTTGDEGEIVFWPGVTFQAKKEAKTLYKKAYDDAKVFVISNTNLANKISSLVLNNKEIRDLSGLEKFVGLDSYLNVSHNYLTDIDPIYELQGEKDKFEALLQQKFNYWLKTRKYGNLTESLKEVKSGMAKAKAQIKLIEKAAEDIGKLLVEASKIERQTVKETVTTDEATGQTTTKTETVVNEKYEEQLNSKVDSINKILDNVYGWTERDEQGNIVEHKGYVDILEEALGEANAKIQGEDGLYYYLSKLYEVYNKDYKLTSLLTPEVNYQTIDEYLKFEQSLLGSTDSVKAIYKNLISRLENTYDVDGLSDFEKEIIYRAMGVQFYAYKENENPITKHFEDFFEDTAQPRTYWVGLIREYQAMAIFTEMYNYCLINRMENDDTAYNYCYAEEYIKNRIENFELEGIDVSVEKDIFEYMEMFNTMMNGFSNNHSQDFEEYLLNLVYGFFEAGYYEVDYEYETVDEYGDPDYIYNEVSTCYGPYTQMYHIVDLIQNYESNTEIAAMAGVDANDEEVAYVFGKIIRPLIKEVNFVETIDINDEWKGMVNELYLYNELIALSSKLVNNSSEVSRYVTLPDLKKLDVSYNALLTGFERITELKGLRELYANSNYITDLSEVNWEDMKYLRSLGLSYNYISDIQALENLPFLRYLDVSHNLISGTLKFNLTKVQGTLKEFDLSYNQITDIRCIMEFLDIWSGGDDANWLAREDTLNLNLNNQNIVIDVEEPIYLDLNPQTIDIELPKIFTQLAAIDVNRTAFGETSQNGRIESEGTYVTLNTRTAGEKQGVVKVIPMSGNGTPVETCIGEGTTATINYTVVGRSVSEVVITEKQDVMKLGEAAMFKAEVKGENLNNTNVVWTVEGASSENTTIDENGKLTIAADEVAREVVVKATSEFDSSKYATVVVKVYENQPITFSLELTPMEVVVKTGDTQEFTAKVNAPEGTDTTVVWTVEGNNSDNTKVSENGVLTVAADETAETLKVKAASKADERVFKEAIVTVEKVVIKVTKVTVTPSENVKVKAGETQKFEATVEGENLTDTSVRWSLRGNESANTKISEDGTLTVAADETAKTLTITARAEADETVTMDVVVAVESVVAEDVVELGYKVDEEFISTINPKTPVSAFKSKLLDNEEYKVVIKKDGEEITSGHMATGMFVQIQDKDGNVVEGKNGLLVFEIVVTGDVNGDGVANSLDSIAIKAHRNEVRGQELAGANLEAADINDDGKVNVTDAKLLLYHRAEVKGYDLNYAK